MRDFSLDNFLPYLLNQAAKHTSLGSFAVYRDRYAMLRTEWRLLFHLGHYGPMIATEIGRLSRMHKTKTNRSVKALKDKRFVTTQAVPGDRRRETLSLLPAGRRAFDDLVGIAEDHNAKLLAQFPPASV